MGWVLTGDSGRLRLPPGTVQVGRAQLALVRPQHQSVSRIHAEIVVLEHEGRLCEVVPSSIRIIDRSSTGHTFINGRMSLGKGQQTPLADGDALTFGVDPEKFIVSWCPIVLSYSSRIVAAEVARMEGRARSAGAFLTPEWTTTCTHLLIDQLAITPKLLCCVADGGMPVAASFLHSLASEPRSRMPVAAEHRPKPLCGPDAHYARELDLCLTAPTPRRDLLQGVWVVFGTKPVFDVLSKALLHAGSQVQLLCCSVSLAGKLAEDLHRSLDAHAAPAEVWIVPAVQEDLASTLAGPICQLGARAFMVQLPAVVRGILVGTLDAVHADATPLRQVKEQSQPSLGREANLAQAKQQTLRNPHAVGTLQAAFGIAPKQSDEKGTQIKEEGSFPATQQQQQHRVQSQQPMQPPQLEQLQQQQLQQQQEKREPVASVVPYAFRAGGGEDNGSRCARDEVKGVKLEFERGEDVKQVSQVSLSCFPVSAPQAASLPPPPSVANPKGEVVQSVLCGTQAKPERCKNPVNVPDATLKPEHAPKCFERAERVSQVKDERADVSGRSENTLGVWLEVKARSTKDSVVVDGVEVPRASWRPGGAEVVPRKAARAQSADARGSNAQQGRFKLFRKSGGQKCPEPAALVDVAPWVPAAAPPLAEVFCSQPLESIGSEPHFPV